MTAVAPLSPTSAVASLAATQRTTWVDANVTDTARTAAAALADGTDPARVAEWLFVASVRIARVVGPVDGDVWARYREVRDRLGGSDE